MTIRYEFDVSKAVAAMVELLRELGETDKIKLIKLLYLADRDCFLKFGHPITGDRFVAMDHGPVPSGCLDVLNGNIQSEVFCYLHTHDRRVCPEDSPPSTSPAALSPEETSVIKATLQRYGHLTTSEIYKLVHELPEYKETYIPGTSASIPFEKLLEHYGTEAQFRCGRPVITRQMRKHLSCPFSESEAAI